MVNVESLLSPSGGRGYEDTVNSGISGLVLGFGLSTTLYDKYLGKPLAEDFRRKNLPGYVEKRAKINRRIEILEKKAAEWDPRGDGSDTYDPKKDPARARATAERQRQKLKNLRSEYKGSKSKLKTTLGIDRKFVRNASWMTLISYGLDMAIEGFTPGVSKLAVRNDQRAMGSENPLDSQASYTMRQRAVMAIHDSMMNVKNVIGNEAQFMHR
jgi:hypothetical protein